MGFSTQPKKSKFNTHPKFFLIYQRATVQSKATTNQRKKLQLCNNRATTIFSVPKFKSVRFNKKKYYQYFKVYFFSQKQQLFLTQPYCPSTTTKKNYHYYTAKMC